jgi:arginine decarboxylase-like protein
MKIFRIAQEIFRGDENPIKLDEYDFDYGRKNKLKDLGSSMAYGPGIYFATAKDIANMYGSNMTSKHISPNAKILSESGRKLNRNIIVKILNSINQETIEAASINWDENPYKGKQMLLNSIMEARNPVDQLMSIWAEVFYHQNPNEFVNIMIQNNIDGISKTKEDVTYFVIYNRAMLT